ncbi:MAG: hypothetical protein KatS3mg086_157 [Candidatus Dojkabacteria bacterium]|nr:MAG: hypothetical protein KatS3mg086_157 [Candidatus Dojkabacteria bacterium]
MLNEFITTNEFNFIIDSLQVDIAGEDTSFDVVKKIEASGVVVSKKVKKYILKKIIDGQTQLLDERKPLDSEFNKLKEEKKGLEEKELFVLYLQTLKNDFEELLNRYDISEVDKRKIDDLKRKKQDMRINDLLGKEGNFVEKDKNAEDNGKKDEPYYFVVGLMILQSIFVLFTLLYKFNLTLFLIGVVSFLFQILFAVLASKVGYYENNLLFELTNYAHPEIDKQEVFDAFDYDESILVKFAMYETIQDEINKIDKYSQEFLNGQTLDQFSNNIKQKVDKMREIHEKLTEIEKISVSSEKLTKLKQEQSNLSGSGLFGDASTLDGEVSVTDKISLGKILVVNHQNALSVEFAREQFNILQEVISDKILYRTQVAQNQPNKNS